jgi:endonuclease YncB( thermonuclease family)
MRADTRDSSRVLSFAELVRIMNRRNPEHDSTRRYVMETTKRSRRGVLAVVGGLALGSRWRRAEAMELPEGIPAGAIEATVVKHIDGDKFEVDINGKKEEVLFIATDAPEVAKDSKAAECFAQESADFLAELIPEDSIVYLEQDEADRDNKKRRLRYVWKVADDPVDDPILVDEVMIEEGYAVFKKRDDNEIHNKRLQNAQDRAKLGEKGIWAKGGCGGGHEPMPTGAAGSGSSGGSGSTGSSSSGSSSSGSTRAQVGSKDNPAKVGTTLTADGQEITLVDYVFTYEYGPNFAKGDHIFLVWEAKVVNVDSKDHGYEALRFTAYDVDNGWEYPTELEPLGDEAFGTGTLKPGQRTSGVGVFEVQESSRRIRLEYDTKYMGDGEVYWLVTR